MRLQMKVAWKGWSQLLRMEIDKFQANLPVIESASLAHLTP